MKLFKNEDGVYLTKEKRIKVCLAASIMTLVVYIIAMILSLSGIDTFVSTYQNERLDKIEEILRNWGIYPMATWLFSTVEYGIMSWFLVDKVPKWYLIIPYYGLMILIAVLLPEYSMIISYFYTGLFYILVIVVDIVQNKGLTKKLFLNYLLRAAIIVAVSFVYQLIIFAIKSKVVPTENSVLPLSAVFIYSLEYDIALFIALYTIALCIKEKGAIRLWATYQVHGGSSQTSTKQLQKSNRKNLPKKQRNKIRFLYFRTYLIQISCFLTVMVLPFLLNKVFEFLLLYLVFAITRYILGFKYSLHYTKESTCFTVGVIVFGFLTLIVPSFDINIILALIFGSGLGIFLHLSYKFKGMKLFLRVAAKDRYAELYVYFNGNTDPEYLKKMGKHWELTETEINILIDFMNKEKLSYLAKKYSYSEIYINKLLDKIMRKAFDHQ